MEASTNDLRKLFDRLLEDTQRFKIAEEGDEAVPRRAAAPASKSAEDEVVELRSRKVAPQAAELDLGLDDDLLGASLLDDLEQKAS